MRPALPPHPLLTPPCPALPPPLQAAHTHRRTGTRRMPVHAGSSALGAAVDGSSSGGKVAEAELRAELAALQARVASLQAHLAAAQPAAAGDGSAGGGGAAA